MTIQEIIGIILTLQSLTAPYNLYKFRKYINDNIVETIRRHPYGYSRYGRQNYPKETYAVLKDGSEINYGSPMLLVGLQIAFCLFGIFLIIIN